MRINGILESTLYADDLAAAERFYTEVLGLAVMGRKPGRHVFFRCGGGVLLIFDPEATRQAAPSGGGAVPTHGARGPGHLAFAVDEADLPVWRSCLQKADVAIESELSWPGGGRSLYFRDPAGNSLELATPAVWGLHSPEPA